ncbi:MAG: hypothetical protein CMD92_06365 [Gammaproteobacteria bacterium]|jgi:hypothetical protein|nr:hypothetical protein [Gammaproteobacteria bacterium]|tara:strand:+ start:3289 stop:3594 length:306 start_codon:yes stop_codon:yes gene_type:complete
MLKQKRYDKDDIVTLVMVGGQELLGKFVSESGEYFILKKPLTLVYGKQISFQPFTVTGDSENEVVLYSDKIVSVLQTNKETTKAYQSATSGLVTPDKGLIT